MADLLAQVQNMADWLLDSRPHTERIEYWDNGNRKVRTHTVVMPSLLDQLRDMVPRSAGAAVEGSIGAAFASKPPLHLEALSRWQEIHADPYWWAQLGIVHELTDTDLRALLSQLRRWYGWCATITGWERTLSPHRATCPQCSERGRLLINLTVGSAMCRDCKATWISEDGSINVLAAHIAEHTQLAA